MTFFHGFLRAVLENMENIELLLTYNTVYIYIYIDWHLFSHYYLDFDPGSTHETW